MDTHRIRPRLLDRRAGSLAGILWVVGCYAAFATLWIGGSDWLLAALVEDPVLMATLGTLKGWAFVAVTSLLLFALLLRFAGLRSRPGSEGETEPEAGEGEGAAEQGDRRESPSLVVGFSVAAVAILLAGVGAVAYTLQKQKAETLGQLKAIAGLKAGQIDNWLGERRRDAELVRTAGVFGADLRRWRQTGDAASGARIVAQMEHYRRILGYRSVLLLDERGQLLLAAGEGMGQPLPEVLRQAVARALEGGKVLLTDFYRTGHGGREQIHLDFVSPLGGAGGEPGLAVVLQVDAREFLFPYIQSWPLASETGEVLLFRREGDHVLFLNDLRHRPDSALKFQVPLSRKELLAVQVVEGKARLGEAVEGVDYRSVSSLGVVQAVAGTDWHLVAKADKDELYADVRKDAFWVALADALALFVTVVIGIIVHQRRELGRARLQRRQQAERLHHLQALQEERKASEEAMLEYRSHLEDLVAERTREVAKLNVELQRRAEEAEAASRAKSAFLANMGHEIRTPLNAILGFTHLLQRTVREPASRDKLERIAQAADHLLKMMNGILDFSKIEAGKLLLEAADFDLGEVLDGVAALAAGKAEARGLRLVAEFAADPACRRVLRGDPGRLSQMLLNYVDNAVKFTEKGAVTLRCLTLAETETDVLVRFEVEDTGIGVAPDRRERLFTAFEQADPSTTRKFGGTGLGLAINQRLARLMGGEVGMRSEPGGGSTFWFTARLARGGRIPAGPGKGLPAPGDWAPADGPGDSPAAALPDPVIPGLDWRAGMRVLRGRRDTYVRLLRQFAKAHANDGAALRSCLRAGDWREAQRLAHNLKGVAGTLGAAEVQAAAAALGHALREHRDAGEVAELGRRLESALEPVLAGILTLLPAEGGNEDPVEVDPGVLERLLDRIGRLAAEDSFAAQDVFREGLPLLRSALGPERVAELADQLGNFDYPAAIETLRRARKEYFGA